MRCRGKLRTSANEPVLFTVRDDEGRVVYQCGPSKWSRLAKRMERELPPTSFERTKDRIKLRCDLTELGRQEIATWCARLTREK